MYTNTALRSLFVRRALEGPKLNNIEVLVKKWPTFSSVCSTSSARVKQFHSHAHHEPEHFAYRGDGLPSIPCEQIQQIVHMNERMARGKLAPMRPATAPLREMECSVEGHNIEVYEDLKELHDRVLALDWHNSTQLILDGDILEARLERLKGVAQDIPDMQVQIMLGKTLEIFDALYKVEDVQDHIFELNEEISHHPGGVSSLESSPETKNNLEKHIKHILERYTQLKKDHPRYAIKIQESIGYSLGALRQCYTFNWPEEHKYFY
ncbi:hypothetical protein X943_000007 [Babesia divergens]|uniref:DUF6827 domain-containing protein n=1 Tax=Babesia divergens TaxID=32595 RepID=A0AAD9GJ44_BABDI|nr:hypothetical protein X943_000007 [Babesia divergens]